MVTQHDGNLGQNADIAGTEPVQRIAKSRERLPVTAYSGRPD